MNADESEAEDRFVEFDAPYVLGALSTQDRATYEAHLAGCAHCQARVRELQDVPALLRTVPVEAVEALSVTMPSATAAASRTQPRWRRVGAGLAVAAAMATALALVATSDDRLPSEDDRSPATVVVQFQPVGDVPLTANVRLTPVDWGTKIDFECSLYGTGNRHRTRILPGGTWPGRAGHPGRRVAGPG